MMQLTGDQSIGLEGGGQPEIIDLVHEAGAREIHVAATHGVLCGPAIKNIQSAPIRSLVITNSIPLRAEQAIAQIEVLSVAPLLAEAIKRIHHDQSVSAMFKSASSGGAD